MPYDVHTIGCPSQGVYTFHAGEWYWNCIDHQQMFCWTNGWSDKFCQPTTCWEYIHIYYIFPKMWQECYSESKPIMLHHLPSSFKRLSVLLVELSIACKGCSCQWCCCYHWTISWCIIYDRLLFYSRCNTRTFLLVY
jgi:hypothetical protein